MRKLGIEFVVGLFMLAGFAAFFYMAIKMGDIGIFEKQTYSVSARFMNTSGLKAGGVVELAGVSVGKVAKIELDPEMYESVVTLEIQDSVKLQEDTIASIRTAGIIGDKFIKLTPGGVDEYLVDGDEIIETESSLDIEELVSKYIFESGDDSE
jgi:phospholipid/cholesterol/gamma-HCH transport system substrate-binding protein